MNAKDYMEMNLLPEYRIFAGSRIVLTTKNTPCPWMLSGKPYCVGNIEINDQYYNFIQDRSKDGSITYGLPRSIYLRINYPQIDTISNWIQEKIFIFMLNNA